MGLGSFVKLFMPKDRVFYSLFEEVTANLTAMGDTFNKAMSETDQEKRSQMLRSLEDMEHKNDEVTHRIFIELGSNFITPFDREDIHALATSLDDIADYTWGSAKRLTNYYIHDVDDTVKGFADIINRSIQALNKGIQELRNMKNLRAIIESCVLINSLENEADDLFDTAMNDLFSRSSIDPIDLIKKKDLYQELEIVTDKCEDAANVIESIIVKYA
jgi:predicted phosphate transport protein (TIGR00153 family)